MWHIVYLTRNLVNGKIYVGVHSTWNLNDGYTGSSVPLNKAIAKHGIDNVERIVLHYCLSREDAFAWEKHIVDESFISRNDTYNMKVGGDGFPIGRHNPSVKRKGKNVEEIYGAHRARLLRKQYGSPKEKHPLWGKGHSEKTRKIISEKHHDVSGKNNPNAKQWYLISPDGVVYDVGGQRRKIVTELGLSYQALLNQVNQPFIIKSTTTNITERVRNSVGWILSNQAHYSPSSSPSTAGS